MNEEDIREFLYEDNQKNKIIDTEIIDWLIKSMVNLT